MTNEKGLRQEHHGRTPEGAFLLPWVQDRHLALILAGGKLRQGNAEAQGMVFSRLSFPPSLPWAGFQTPSSAGVVEAHKGDQRLERLRALLVGLQVDVHVAALAEDARYAGNQLLPVRTSGFAVSARSLAFTAL